jgi:hypothetical protein
MYLYLCVVYTGIINYIFGIKFKNKDGMYKLHNHALIQNQYARINYQSITKKIFGPPNVDC